MHTSRLAIAASCSLLLVATAAAAQQRVYQWKDANGVTHYTDMPPAQTHKTRDISNKSGAAANTATATVAESKPCTDARENMQRLQGTQAVGIDVDGDGKPDRNLSAEERAAQADLNRAAVKAYCTAAP